MMFRDKQPLPRNNPTLSPNRFNRFSLRDDRAENGIMATFLVLPPREVFEHSVAEFLGRILPGFPVPAGMWERIVRDMTAERDANSADPLFVLHREDFTDENVAESLVHGFGAERGDGVVEIDTPRSAGAGRSRTWRIQSVPTFISAR